MHPSPATRVPRRARDPKRSRFKPRARIIRLLFCAGFLLFLDRPTHAEEPSFTISNRTLNPVSDLLFGQMMERAGKAIGPEVGLIPGTHDLQPEVIRLLEEMKIPIIRFPGGGVIDHQDWTSLIDHAPGGAETRLPGEFFGYDEYLRLVEKLGCQTIFPVNFRIALSKEKSLDEASLLAAGLVAYCNAPLGAKLPPGMPDWPSIRALNGHPAPYGVKYFQIGNEMFGFYAQALKEAGVPPQEQIDWCLTCIRKYLEAMRAVDPTIKIIVEGVTWSPENTEVVERILSDPFIRQHADYVAHHLYRPWNFKVVKLNGTDVPMDSIPPEEMWNACVDVPFMDAEGRSVLQGDPMPGRHLMELAEKLHWKIAMTEWNWNGGGKTDTLAHSLLAHAIGTAGFIHAIIRSGGQIDLATQSMLIGASWDIRAITADPLGKSLAHMNPPGEMTVFYDRYHGSRNLDVTARNVPTNAQPVTLGQIEPKEKAAVLDAIATATDRKVFFHVINRDFQNDQPITLHLDGFKISGKAIQHTFEGRLTNDYPPAVAQMSDKEIPVGDGSIQMTVPKRSVAILEMDAQPATR